MAAHNGTGGYNVNQVAYLNQRRTLAVLVASNQEIVATLHVLMQKFADDALNLDALTEWLRRKLDCADVPSAMVAEVIAVKMEMIAAIQMGAALQALYAEAEKSRQWRERIAAT